MAKIWPKIPLTAENTSYSRNFGYGRISAFIELYLAVTAFRQKSSFGHTLRVIAHNIITRKRVVLQDDLMNDAAAGFPEANSVLGSSSGEEVVYLLVHLLGALQVLLPFDLCLNQVVAVDS